MVICMYRIFSIIKKIILMPFKVLLFYMSYDIDVLTDDDKKS